MNTVLEARGEALKKRNPLQTDAQMMIIKLGKIVSHLDTGSKE